MFSGKIRVELMTIKLMFPQRATTKQLFGLVNIEEPILIKTLKYMSILDKTHLKTEIFESREKLEQSLCKVTSRSSIATK